MGVTLQHDMLTHQAVLESKQKELEEENQQLHRANKILQQQASYLSNQIQKAQSSGFQPTRGYTRTKSPSEYSICHQYNLKHQRTEKCASSLAWLKAEGYSVMQVTLRDDNTGEITTIDMPTANLLSPQQDPPADTELDTLNMMLYIKDKFNISGEAYHEMAQPCNVMPRHYQLKQCISELNKLWDIYPTPNDTCGVQQSLKQMLHRIAGMLM